MRPEGLKSWTLEVDYSRAPCIGADQKTRGLWEQDFRPLVKGNEALETRLSFSSVIKGLAAKRKFGSVVEDVIVVH